MISIYLTAILACLLPLVCRGDGLYMGNTSPLQLPALPQLPNLPKLPTLDGFPNMLSQLNGNEIVSEEDRVPCTCGIFLSGQITKKSQEPPKGNAALLQELTDQFQCNAIGERQCINKCLETMMRHLPNSGAMICGSIDRDCFKERAYLLIKNCKDKWVNSNMSAGKEYCCKEGFPYKCPPS